MRRILPIVLLPILLLVAACSTPPTPPIPTPIPTATVTPTCDQSLWSYVYHPSRLHMLQQCITVAGVVQEVRLERDGDAHIILTPDDTTNYGLSLVAEAICNYAPITQQDAAGPCTGLTQQLTLPQVGWHIAVTGSYVQDIDHGWPEIHPISSIQEIP